MLLSVVVVSQAWEHKNRVNQMSLNMLLRLGQGVKTMDELRDEFREAEYPIFLEALNDLLKNGKVLHRSLMLADKDGVTRSRLERFKVEVYYAP
jgi:hypothetical protein